MRYYIFFYIIVHLLSLNVLAKESDYSNNLSVDILNKKELETKCGCYYEKKSMKDSIVVYWTFEFKNHNDEKAILKINNKLETLGRKSDKFNTFGNKRYTLSVDTKVVHINNYENQSCQEEALEEGIITVSDKRQSFTIPIVGSCGC